MAGRSISSAATRRCTLKCQCWMMPRWMRWPCGVKLASRTILKALTVSEIVDITDRAIARLLDRNDPYRRKCEALLPLVTGYDAEMVRLGLTGYLKTFRKPNLQKFIAEDFANPKNSRRISARTQRRLHEGHRP